MIYEIENLVLVNELPEFFEIIDFCKSIGFNMKNDFDLIGFHSRKHQLSEEQCPGLNAFLQANDLYLENPIDESGNSFKWFDRESRTGPFIILKSKVKQ